MVVCFQDVTGKKNYIFTFEDSNKIEKSSHSLLYVFYKEELEQEVDDSISDLTKK